jgi:hypothetical protein
VEDIDKMMSGKAQEFMDMYSQLVKDYGFFLVATPQIIDGRIVARIDSVASSDKRFVYSLTMEKPE